MTKLKFTTKTAIALSTMLVASFTSCTEDKRKDLIEKARLNGKLQYEWQIIKWCKKNNVNVNWEQVDSSYYAACKTCY